MSRKRLYGLLARSALAAAVVPSLLGGPSAARADIVVGGVTYTATGATESVNPLFTNPSGAVTSNQFHGLVEITVSGTGQSNAQLFNDAFYYNIPGTPTHDANYYQLEVTKTASLSLNSADDAYQNIVYDVNAGTAVTPPYTPAYRSDHTYTFVLDTTRLTGSASSVLRLGVDDGIYTDNSGSYNITITQLVASVPEPGPFALAGLAALAFGIVRRKGKDRV